MGIAARNSDPETSRQAAIVAARSELKLQVLKAMTNAGTHGLTDDELVNQLRSFKATTVTSRGRLSRTGVVVDSGMRRNSDRGCPQIVWVLATNKREIGQ